ncbi:MAG: acriflavine resistance protein B [Verrucomicrobia bacterium]|nr:acriflavine resistance protein B [Verrucomicrobiota bacterium]
MNIAEPFIRRPVMTTLVMSSILLFGIMAYKDLPVSDLPNVDFPTIQVSARLSGASPETMASSVATVLERQFSTISGIESMSSSSSQGSTQITLQFSLNRDIDAAAQDVQSAISRSQRQLPADMTAPPSFQKSNPADSPIVFATLTTEALPLSTLTEYGETVLGQRLSMQTGVAQVQVFGSQKYAVRIQLDPHALASRGIGIDEVADAVDRQNVNLPTGSLVGPYKTYSVQASGQLFKAIEFEPLIVAYRNGAPVRLRELGQVTDSVENDRSAAWRYADGKEQRTIMLAIFRQPGHNTVEVAAGIRKEIEKFKQQLPASMSLNIHYDRSESIRESFTDVKFTLMLTLILVVLVIFVFLRNVSATIIPSMSLPMSIIGTFVVMHMLDYSLDNLSLMAITLAVGFVVDDAIVVLENIVRHMEMGKPRLQAALDGTKEVGFTIVSMTLSLAAVFLPVMFMSGLVGRIFREFAVTIGIAVLISGFISLTLTPMLSSRFLRSPAEVHHGRIYIFTERMFSAVLRFYDVSLRWVLLRRLSTLVLSFAILAATVMMFIDIPRDLIPSQDQGILIVGTDAAEGTSHTAMFSLQRRAASIIQENPNVAALTSSSGGSGGRMFIRLKPRKERRDSADQIVQQLRRSVASIPGLRVFIQVPPMIQAGGRSTKSQYQYTLQGSDVEDLYRVANALAGRLRNFKELQDVTTDAQLKNPVLDVKINRDLASTLGLSPAQIQGSLYAAYGSRQISTIYAPNNQYAVLMELMPQYQANAEALSLLHVRSSSGVLVPVKSVSTATPGVGPLSINHSGQLPSVTVSFALAPNVSLGDALKLINGVADNMVPPSIVTGFQGTAQLFQTSNEGMALLLILAIVVIYIVLGILYENFFHPITILSALPFAGFGALLTLMLFNASLSMYSYVGIIMLVGLVKKNGIMMVDFAIEAQRNGAMAPTDAIHHACLIRFRPIMMTTFAALMAAIPIAMGYGAGGEARRPLGLAVVGGLIFSQTLTLYVTPVFYVYMEKLQHWLKREKSVKAEDPARAADVRA